MAEGSDTIRAARLHTHGEPLVVERVVLPEPTEGEVRVELEFGGVNPIDRYLALGRVNPAGPLPRTPGGEAAGTLDGVPVLVAGEGRAGKIYCEWDFRRLQIQPLPVGLLPYRRT